MTGAYSIALHLEISGPIAMVVAGLFIGNQGTTLAMSETTRLHVETFWDLVDEILNSVLFLLIGLKIVFLLQDSTSIFLLVAVDSVCSGDIACGCCPRLHRLADAHQGPEFRSESGAVPILTWAGIRGGVSVALALSLPESSESSLLLFVTYFVVLFSVAVQGLDDRETD